MGKVIKNTLSFLSVLLLIACTAVIVYLMLSGINRKYNIFKTHEGSSLSDKPDYVYNKSTESKADTQYSGNNPDSSEASQDKLNQNLNESNNADLEKYNPEQQQILDALGKFITETGIFDSISVKLIDEDTAESRGTFTSDIDSILRKYPGLAAYKSHLQFAAGQDVYALTRIETNDKNQLVPSFEKLYIGILPIPSDFINSQLEGKGYDFNP